MKRLMIIGLWPDDAVNYCTEKCDCRRYAFDRILYHRGGRAARERICIPVVDRSGAVTTYLDLPVTLLEAGVVYLRLGNGINHELCMKFVKSGYDLKAIEESV